MSDQNAAPPAAVTVIQPKPVREFRPVEDNSAIAYLMDTSRFDHCYRIAGAMARASLIPKHLKGDSLEQTTANCFLVVNQSIRWGFDPFAVAPETYEVGGKLGFSGKLVAAVINVRGGLEANLSYTFNDAKGDALEVTVSGCFQGEAAPRTVTLSVAQAKTSNQMWTKDPHQKLIYSGATKWARRHKPEVILGVLTDDDAEAIRDEAKFIAATAVKSPDFGPSDGSPKRKAITQAKTADQPAKTPQDAPTGQVSHSEPSASGNAAPAPSAEGGSGESEATGQSQGGDLGPQSEFVPDRSASEETNNLLYLAHKSGVTEAQICVWAKENKLMKAEQRSISELAASKLVNIAKSWENISASIKAIKA